ncbi:endonuclease 2 [Corylus avellana]|uniref:endonuclease 2 n=1 Tax=Corylus avellana TaxID=13451 RepID=UPI00286CC03F|nr:endonuclease 2 [Corylus avellana]
MVAVMLMVLKGGRKMKCCRAQIVAIVSLMLLFPVINAWGNDGHYIVCKIAQSRLNKAAAEIVEELLPKSAENELESVCSWADEIKFHYPWSRPLHYVNTPDVCNYQFERDCKDESGEQGRCVAGAVQNYTKQLLTIRSNDKSSNNLTEALLFYSHFMGDIHQPLHAGFASDKGGNTIGVHWYTRKQNLHHVWDDNIIETAQERFYNSNVDDMIGAIQKNITTAWADQVQTWENCSYTDTTCANVYASEGIKAACDWAYKGVTEGSVLEDEYFLSRLPIVNLRLAQAGVRLAAILNHYFVK